MLMLNTRKHTLVPGVAVGFDFLKLVVDLKKKKKKKQQPIITYKPIL